MGLSNKLCKYCINEPGLKSGFRCIILDIHLDKSDDLFRDFCDTYGNFVKCPYYID